MKYKKYIIPVATLILGLILGAILFSSNEKSNDVKEGTEIHDHSEEAGIWTCSMHPQIKAEEPGSCPICGMDLIPLQTSSNVGSPTAVKMTKEAIAMAGIETYEITAGSSSSQIELYGKVAINENKAFVQVAHFPGRLDRFNIKTVGEYVKKGEAIATIYSPMLVQAQKELLEAAKMKGSNSDLYNASIDKLKQWNLRKNQINNIIKRGKPIEDFVILSDFTGYVWEIQGEEGTYVKEGAPLFKIADLSSVWIDFDVYEKDLPSIKLGSTINFKIEGLSGSVFTGKTIFVSPVINPNTRVATARVKLSNKEYTLKPGQYAWGTIAVSTKKGANTIVIPRSAVLWTGKRSLVYVQVPNIDEPQYELHQIVLGNKIGESYVVEDGLQVGENIVMEGAFTVDATAQLEGKPSMLQPNGGKKNTGHEGMNMGGNSKPLDMQAGKVMAPEAFKDQLTTFTKSYISLKDAFVDSDEKAIKDALVSTTKNLKRISMKGLNNDAMKKWHPALNTLEGLLKKTSSTSDLKMQRETFELLSNELIKTIKTFGIHNEVYVIHCPMFGGDGGDWISNSKEVKNPYFGQNMLNCGDLKEIITK